MDNKPMALSADSSGVCKGYAGKEAAHWVLKDGILRFYGKGVITAEPVKICGEMLFDPYQGYVKSPWDRSQVHTVIIEEGITEIGAAAFDEVPHIIYHGPVQCDKNWGVLRRN